MRVTGWRLPLMVGALLRVAAWAAGLWNGGWVLTDTPQYWGLASDGLAGYGASDGQFFIWGLMRPPGYPAILAILRLVHDSYAAAALLQVGFGLAALGLTYALARKLAGEAAASLAAWWLALSPIQVVFSSVLLTEVPFSVFLMTAALLLAPLVERDAIRGWRWAASGLALGLATLIRPITFYLPIAVLAVLALSKLRGRLVIPAIVFLAAFAVPVGGWLARNHRVTGVATISTIEGFNLAYYRAAGAVAAQDRTTIDKARFRIFDLVEAEHESDMNPAELSRVQSRVGIREILRHPLGYAYSTLRGLAFTLAGPARSHFNRRFQGTPAAALTPLLGVLSGASAILMSIASIAGAWSWARARQWRRLLLVAFPVLYMLIIGSGQEAWARFRVPLEPLLAVLAAVGVLYFREVVVGQRQAIG